MISRSRNSRTTPAWGPQVANSAALDQRCRAEQEASTNIPNRRARGLLRLARRVVTTVRPASIGGGREQSD
jgi:hypothetical protein